MNKNILIIVYKFPPMGGIGTRRWAKFSKYLAKNNYNVHVLTSYYPYEDKLNWKHDIVDENITVHKYKTLYPYWLLKKSKSVIIEKIKRVIKFILFKTVFYIDNAQYDSKEILLKSKEIILEYKINNVIASGHPMSINYISTYLKIDLSHINLIQDYRDNWNDLNIYQYGNKNGLRTFKQKEKIAFQEYFTLIYSDLIINVSDDLTKALKNKHKNLEDKLITVTNGFDKDDFKKVDISKNDEFNLIYAGSLFNHRIDAVNLLLDAILELDDSFINDNFKIIIYSNYDKSRLNIKYKKLIDKNIFFYSLVSPSEIMNIMATKRYCLSINSEFAPYAFGTKIFDYMALNKKILHISNGGVLFDILRKKNQYVCSYDIEKMKCIIVSMKNDFLKNDLNEVIDYEEYSIENLTLKLEKYFV